MQVSASTVAVLGLLLFVVLMMLKLPVSFSLFIAGFAGILYLSPSPEAAFNMLASNVWGQMASYAFSVIPFYIFMGEIVFRTGISQTIFDAAYKWVGRFRGGLASTTILACAGFASISGSTSATAATIGTIALPELRKYKYSETLSTGSIAAGGTLGTIIPPSTVLIVIAFLTQQSIGELFVASVIPGLLLAVLMIGVIAYLIWRHPDYGPPSEQRFTFKEKIVSTLAVFPIFLLFAFVIGGLFFGWFTPTESGAFGAFGALVITWAMRRLTWERFKTAVVSTLKTSAMIMMLIISAVIFGKFLTMTRLSFVLVDFINGLNVSPLVILLIVIIIFVIGGAIMDAMGFLMIAVPIFFPVITNLGYDPVWFGVLVCVLTSMGAITPPIGLNVFVVKGLSPTTPLTTVFKGANYFLAAYAVFIALCIMFPQIITFVL